MKLPVLKAPILVNIVTVIFSVIISGFTLLFGIAHLIEGRNPNIPYSEHLLGLTFVIILCVVGVIFLVIAIAAIRGILDKLNRKPPIS